MVNLQTNTVNIIDWIIPAVTNNQEPFIFTSPTSDNDLAESLESLIDVLIRLFNSEPVHVDNGCLWESIQDLAAQRTF